MFSLKGFIIGAIVSIIYLISEYLDSKYQDKEWHLIEQQKDNSLKELKEFERLYQKYKGDFKVWKQYCDNAKNSVILFIKKQANFDIVPLEYQNNVYNMAWERGHSSGYYGVYQELCELVELFNI